MPRTYAKAAAAATTVTHDPTFSSQPIRRCIVRIAEFNRYT